MTDAAAKILGHTESLQIYDRYSEMHMDLEITKSKVPRKRLKDQIKKGRTQIEKSLRHNSYDRDTYVRDYQASEDALELLVATSDPVKWPWANTRNYVLGNKTSDARLPLSQRLGYLGFQVQNSLRSEGVKSEQGIVIDGVYTYAHEDNKQGFEATFRRIKSDMLAKSFKGLENSSSPLSKGSPHVCIYISPKARSLDLCPSNGIIPFKIRSELRRKIRVWTTRNRNWLEAEQKLNKQTSLRYKSPVLSVLGGPSEVLVILWLTQILNWRPTREQADAAIEESSRGMKELALQSFQNSKASPRERESCESNGIGSI